MDNYGVLEVKKRKDYKSKRNLIAKNLRSSKYSQKVVHSKKLYNRKKEKKNTLKAAAIKEI
jgi:hypothetical protein